MNDSFGKISSPVPPRSNNGAGRGAQIVQIIKLPDALQTTAKALRLEGQVTQVNANGTARIDTPEGRVDVQLRGNRQPQVGQRLEVDIPAGRPARQASIRNAPAQTGDAPRNNTPQSSSTAPQQPPPSLQTQITSTTPTPQQQGAQQTTQQNAQQAVQQAQQNTQVTTTPRTLPQTPVPASVQEAVTQQPNTVTSQPRVLAQEAIVRLLAVPPAQAQNIASEFIQTLPQPQNNVLARVNFASNIIAQNASTQQTQALLQIATPPTQNSSTNILTATLNTTSQSVLQPIQNITLLPPITAPDQTANTANFTALSPQQNIAPTIPTTQTLSPNLANTLLQTPTAIIPSTSASTSSLNATLTAVPVNFDPTNPNVLIPERFAKIDIQVLKITPPVPLITTPTSAGAPPLQSIPAAINFTPPLIGTNNATTLTAQVTGFTNQGLPLVTARFPNSPLPQSFILQQSTSNLQLGSQIQFAAKSIPTNAQIVQPLQSQGLTTLLQGFQWPALDELYNGLLQISPNAAASLTRALPNAGNPAQMGPAAMMFIAAVRSGDISGWLGDKKIDLLQRVGKADMLSRLSQGASNTARAPAAEATPSSDWRAVPLPMFWEGEIHKITLFTRHENQSGQQENQENNQTRFVFDLSLSRMGDVQLDGLLRDGRLDLVVRAQNTFSESMQQTMRQAYSGALGHTDLTGELNFQGDSKNWVHVLEKKEELGVHV